MSDKRKNPPPISVRFTHEELDVARADAEANGMTLSALFRQKVLGDKQAPRKRRRKVRRPVKDKKALSKVFALLGKSRLASNLNQLARAVNSGSLIVSPDIEKMIKEACRDIRFIRMMLMKALGLYEDEDDGEDFQP